MEALDIVEHIEILIRDEVLLAEHEPDTVDERTPLAHQHHLVWSVEMIILRVVELFQ